MLFCKQDSKQASKMIWRVMLSSKLWNQSAYEHMWHTNPSARVFAQSKGRARMRVLPTTRDEVWFVLRGHVVMKGVVLTDGFMEGDDHKTHECNIGAIRAHATPSHYAYVKITEIGLAHAIAPSGQRTWAQVR